MFNFELESFRSFRDRPESPFYQSDGLTPEQTWGEVTDRLVILIRELLASGHEHEISLDQFRAWHGFLFETTFPLHAGRLRSKDDQGRWEHVDFGVDIGTVRTATIRLRQGAHPKRIEKRLRTACAEFNESAAKIRTAERPSVGDATFAAARLYAKILSVHPFIDGNLRAAYVALQAALLNLDLVAIQFQDLDKHDDALGYGLRTDGQQTYGPMAKLLERTIKEAV